MAKAEYWQRGDAIDFTNATETAIEANELVIFGEHVGVAGTNIAPSEVGSLYVTSVFEIPKDDKAIGAGASVYFNGTAGSATKAEGAVLAGYAVQAAAANDATVKVKFQG